MRNSSFVRDNRSAADFCLFPSYFSNYAVLILVAVAVVVQLSHLIKIGLMIFIAGKFDLSIHTSIIYKKNESTF